MDNPLMRLLRDRADLWREQVRREVDRRPVCLVTLIEAIYRREEAEVLLNYAREIGHGQVATGRDLG